MVERRDPHRFDDLFSAFGAITLRRFFGGEGICSGDIMFGMVFGERIYFKTNDETRKSFLAEGCEPFTFEKSGEVIVTGWYALPERLYDDPDELASGPGPLVRSLRALPRRRRSNARRSPSARDLLGRPFA